MERNTLETSIEGIRAIWGPINTELIAGCRRHLETLATAPATEAWLGALHREEPASRELYRDPTHGFVLLAHTEQVGQYRAPHDHGRGWVIYAVQRGGMEMSTYGRIVAPDRSVKLVKRSSTIIRAGQVQVYLPGDIHDTRCLSGPVLQFRFTERDLKKEDQQEHRVTRYLERDGVWTTGAPCLLP